MPKPKKVSPKKQTKSKTVREGVKERMHSKDAPNIKDLQAQHAATEACFSVINEIYQACEEPHIYPHLERALESLTLAHQLYCVLRRNEK